MVFSSVTFLFIFLPVTAALYFLPSVFLCHETGIKWKNLVLLAASLFFYAWGEPLYVFLMLISITFNYFIGLDLKKHSGNQPHKRFLLVFALVFNLGSLAFFKYSGFIAENLSAVFPAASAFDAPALPIGISFYTFQTLSYVIDVYNGKCSTQTKFTDFALYVSMFPQLIAGPIVQYNTVEAQLTSRRETLEGAADGIRFFVIGLAKKVILANTAGAIYNEVLAGAGEKPDALSAWLAIILYTFQIYYDFSGYSDMAIGLGRIFGFSFPENFRYPYVANSVTDFWRRWHISLSSWFRDYLYIPLGGNRSSIPRNVFNLLFVWFMTGLWHGASWNFVLWGMYYGVLLLLERYVFAKLIERVPQFIRQAVVFLFVVIGWVFFSNASTAQAFQMLAAMFGANGAYNPTAMYYLTGNLAVICTMAVFVTPLFRIKSMPQKKLHRFVLLAVTVVLFFASTVCLISDTYNPFLYFRF